LVWLARWLDRKEQRRSPLPVVPHAMVVKVVLGPDLLTAVRVGHRLKN
jgi:hypothetical protein